MFKSFTWTKFLADMGVVTAIVTGPFAGIVGSHTAAAIGAISFAVRAIASAVTTVQSGTATDLTNAPINSK